MLRLNPWFGWSLRLTTEYGFKFDNLFSSFGESFKICFISVCCNIQMSCKSCDNIYAVNGIVYCCPGCSGIVIVTDLVCRCYPPTGFSFQNINCSLSDKVVGDYIAWRPSYYIAGARNNIFFWLSLFIGVILTRVATLLWMHAPGITNSIDYKQDGSSSYGRLEIKTTVAFVDWL